MNTSQLYTVRRSFLSCAPSVLLCLCWVLSVPLACMFGPVDYSSQVLAALAETVGIPGEQGALSDDSLLLVVGEIRFSRTVLALFAGGGLALAGVAMQGALRNPLADPFLMGVSSGAASAVSSGRTTGTNCLAILLLPDLTLK